VTRYRRCCHESKQARTGVNTLRKKHRLTLAKAGASYRTASSWKDKSLMVAMNAAAGLVWVRSRR
jgi:hypothetical protein